MKIILSIARVDVVEAVSRALLEHNYHVTHISSTGGFLRRGNTTLVSGVTEDQVEGALHVIREVCRAAPQEKAHRATIFVLDASQFFQI
jgi:uncharacterized protein YaaQ